jgi:hypothetical protein
LSEITISEFINEISTKNMNQGNFILLKFLAACSDITLQSESKSFFQSNTSFQFSLKSKQITISKFLIKINSKQFSVHWKLEGSPDQFAETKKWKAIFEMTNQQCPQNGSNILIFDSQSINIFSSIRFSMIGKNSVNSSELSLEGFEIFGTLMDINNNISLLKKMDTRTKPSIHQSTSYSFPLHEESHFGLFNFLSSFPTKLH